MDHLGMWHTPPSKHSKARSGHSNMDKYFFSRRNTPGLFNLAIQMARAVVLDRPEGKGQTENNTFKVQQFYSDEKLEVIQPAITFPSLPAFLQDS